MVLAVGSRVKDFTIDKFLGKGSYGAVYKCTRKDDGLPYAMKQINTRNMSHKERQDSVNEIRILASVVNPYVIRFCEAFVEEDMLYIITEYANHGDLFKRLGRLKQRHQSLPEDACWIYFIQLCLGVQALHRNNILHRDLKSANVFLASHNRLKIGDLGVAKLLRAQEAYAKTQIGTPYYVSPELWKNKPYNSKSDVWALGCLLYEMVELKPPFDSTNMRGLARKVLRGVYPTISTHYSPEISQMIESLLVVNPNERPSVDEVLQMDSIVRRMSMLPPEDLPSSARADGPLDDLVGTIHVPRKMRDLTKQLPSPRYDSDANSTRASSIADGPAWKANNSAKNVQAPAPDTSLPNIGESGRTTQSQPQSQPQPQQRSHAQHMPQAQPQPRHWDRRARVEQGTRQTNNLMKADGGIRHASAAAGGISDSREGGYYRAQRQSPYSSANSAAGKHYGSYSQQGADGTYNA